MCSKPLLVIISNVFKIYDGIKAASRQTTATLFSEFFPIILIVATMYAAITLALNELPFILIVMWLWCNRTTFKVKSLNRSLINAKWKKEPHIM